jgi:hypothetical protein
VEGGVGRRTPGVKSTQNEDTKVDCFLVLAIPVGKIDRMSGCCVMDDGILARMRVVFFFLFFFFGTNMPQEL